MTPAEREAFDREVESVLTSLPDEARRLLDEVPMIVEDYPAPRVLRLHRARHRDEICGLYHGIPLTERSVADGGQLSDAIYVYREGVCSQTRAYCRGRLEVEELRRQIRITILHEIGHHFGLSEEDLRELGYD